MAGFPQAGDNKAFLEMSNRSPVWNLWSEEAKKMTEKYKILTVKGDDGYNCFWKVNRNNWVKGSVHPNHKKKPLYCTPGQALSRLELFLWGGGFDIVAADTMDMKALKHYIWNVSTETCFSRKKT